MWSTISFFNDYYFSVLLSFTGLTAEPAALLFFLFLLFEVWVDPDILIGHFWDGYQLPLLNMSHYRFFDELGWRWLENFLILDVGFFDSVGLVYSDRPLDLSFSVVCYRLVDIAGRSKVNVTVVIATLSTALASTFASGLYIPMVHYLLWSTVATTMVHWWWRTISTTTVPTTMPTTMVPSTITPCHSRTYA